MIKSDAETPRALATTAGCAGSGELDWIGRVGVSRSSAGRLASLYADEAWQCSGAGGVDDTEFVEDRKGASHLATAESIANGVGSVTAYLEGSVA